MASIYNRRIQDYNRQAMTTKRKRGPAPGTPRSPANPGRVTKIVRLRDEERLTFTAIAARIGGTRMNCCALYNRWHGWVRDRRTAAE